MGPAGQAWVVAQLRDLFIACAMTGDASVLRGGGLLYLWDTSNAEIHGNAPNA